MAPLDLVRGWAPWCRPHDDISNSLRYSSLHNIFVLRLRRASARHLHGLACAIVAARAIARRVGRQPIHRGSMWCFKRVSRPRPPQGGCHARESSPILCACCVCPVSTYILTRFVGAQVWVGGDRALALLLACASLGGGDGPLDLRNDRVCV